MRRPPIRPSVTPEEALARLREAVAEIARHRAQTPPPKEQEPPKERKAA